MTIDVIFLGLDGVLFDTEIFQLQAFNMAFAQAGLQLRWEMSEMRKAIRIYGSAGVMAGIAKVSNGRHARDLALQLTELKHRAFHQLVTRGKPEVLPAAMRLIADAHHAGCKLSVLSDTPAASTAAMLEHSFGDDVNSRFAVVSGGVNWQGLAGTGPYAHALHAMGIAPRDAIAIDTNPQALRAARSCGVWTVSACPNDINDASISGADLWCPQLQELRSSLADKDAGFSLSVLDGMRSGRRTAGRLKLPIPAPLVF
jgi:beta-phosphoglucomutase